MNLLNLLFLKVPILRGQAEKDLDQLLRDATDPFIVVGEYTQRYSSGNRVLRRQHRPEKSVDVTAPEYPVRSHPFQVGNEGSLFQQSAHVTLKVHQFCQSMGHSLENGGRNRFPQF